MVPVVWYLCATHCIFVTGQDSQAWVTCLNIFWYIQGTSVIQVGSGL